MLSENSPRGHFVYENVKVEEVVENDTNIVTSQQRSGQKLPGDIKAEGIARNSNQIVTQRLVQKFPGDNRAVDIDCGISFSAVVYSFGSPIKPTDQRQPCRAKRVRPYRNSLGSFLFCPAYSATHQENTSDKESAPDSSLEWYYFCDGKHDLCFAFPALTDVREIGRNFIPLSLTQGGESVPVLILKLTLKSEQMVYLDVTEVSGLSRSLPLYPSLSCPYSTISSEVYHGVLLSSHKNNYNYLQGESVLVKTSRGWSAANSSREKLIADMLSPVNNAQSEFLYEQIYFSRVSEEGSTLVSKSYLTLRDVLLGEGRVVCSERGVKTLLFSLLLSIQNLHEKGIAHLQINPETVGLTFRGRVRSPQLDLGELSPLLKDFGGAAFCPPSPGETGEEGLKKVKLAYGDWIGKNMCLPPELCPWRKEGRGGREAEESCYDARKVDVWQIGILLFYILTKTEPLEVSLPLSPPFSSTPLTISQECFFVAREGGFSSLRFLDAREGEGKEKEQSLKEIVRNEDALSLLLGLLFLSPVERLSPREAAAHPWFRDVQPTERGERNKS